MPTVHQLKVIVRSLFREISEDRASLVAAGCTYYLLFALFPALAAFVSLYGFVADPETVSEHTAFLAEVLPASVVDILQDQLDRLAAASSASLSFALIAGLGVAVWGANNGVKTLFQAMNVAYGAVESRNFFRLNLVTVGFTLGGLLLAIALIVGIGIVPVVLNLVGLAGSAEEIISTLRWPLLMILIMAGVALLYRFGPCRSPPRWRDVLPGTLLVGAGWLIASLLFSWYLANFANYNATYGSLGAIIGALTWTWIAMFILIVGAELNATLEVRKGDDVRPATKEAASAEGRGTVAPTIGGARYGRGGTRTVRTISDASVSEASTRAGFFVGSWLRGLAGWLADRFSSDRRRRS